MFTPQYFIHMGHKIAAIIPKVQTVKFRDNLQPFSTISNMNWAISFLFSMTLLNYFRNTRVSEERMHKKPKVSNISVHVKKGSEDLSKKEVKNHWLIDVLGEFGLHLGGNYAVWMKFISLEILIRRCSSDKSNDWGLTLGNCKWPPLGDKTEPWSAVSSGTLPRFRPCENVLPMSEIDRTAFRNPLCDGLLPLPAPLALILWSHTECSQQSTVFYYHCIRI